MRRKARAAGKLPGLNPFCRNWAVPGRRRCRFHGGKSTGPRTPEGKAASLAARLEGRRRRIAELAREGRTIATGHNGGRPRKDGQPMKRRTTTTKQQILAAFATLAPSDGGQQHAARTAAPQAAAEAAGRQVREELALQQSLLRAIHRGSDAALVRNPRDPAKRQDLIAKGLEALATLRQKWRGPT